MVLHCCYRSCSKFGGDRVEAYIGHRIMNRSHAYWSFGFFGAGIVGAGFSQLGISPFSHFALITALSSVLTILFLQNMMLLKLAGKA